MCSMVTLQHGSDATVAKSDEVHMVGVSGIVVRETPRTLVLVTPDNKHKGVCATLLSSPLPLPSLPSHALPLGCPGSASARTTTLHTYSVPKTDVAFDIFLFVSPYVTVLPKAHTVLALRVGSTTIIELHADRLLVWLHSHDT